MAQGQVVCHLDSKICLGEADSEACKQTSMTRFLCDSFDKENPYSHSHGFSGMGGHSLDDVLGAEVILDPLRETENGEYWDSEGERGKEREQTYLGKPPVSTEHASNNPTWIERLVRYPMSRARKTKPKPAPSDRGLESILRDVGGRTTYIQ